MEIFNQQIESEPTPKDISKEFMNMPSSDFRRFLRTLKKESFLSIAIDWVDIATARKLKAFLEDSSAFGKQKRSATIRATEKQYKQELNVFTSGINWEKI